MKKSDLVIIVIGCIIAATILAGLVYIAFMVNNGNAGLNGTF